MKFIIFQSWQFVRFARHKRNHCAANKIWRSIAIWTGKRSVQRFWQASQTWPILKVHIVKPPPSIFIIHAVDEARFDEQLPWPCVREGLTRSTHLLPLYLSTFNARLPKFYSVIRSVRSGSCRNWQAVLWWECISSTQCGLHIAAKRHRNLMISLKKSLNQLQVAVECT